jgi:phenylacetic acid degradation operon negative regulatory protein
MLPRPFETPYNHSRRLLHGNLSYKNYNTAVYRLRKRGLVEVVNKNNGKFLRLTKEGQLETLLAKAKLPGSNKWDGKWRLMMFDIPEGARDKRNRLRGLLKQNNFYKLQASVYINPYPLNREAVNYLKETKLMEYIRILRVDEMDEDEELRKRFGL